MNTQRITRKVLVTLLYLTPCDDEWRSKGVDLFVGKQYRLLEVDGYHGIVYVDVKGYGTIGYPLSMSQIAYEKI